MRVAVIGNSAAAISAIESFRRYDQKSTIVLISREEHAPYSRVLLPYLLQGKIDYDDIFFRSARFYDENKVETFLGKSVIEMNTSKKELYLESGEHVPFDKLLISSGSSPVKPQIPGLEDVGIGHLWTIEDADRINLNFEEQKHLLIVGGGFISLMLAWVALQNGIKVTVVELLTQIMPQVLDKRAAELLEKIIRRSGINLLTGTVIEKIEKTQNGQYHVFIPNQPYFCVDSIVVAAGVKPNTGFVDTNRIKTEKGILVDEKMQTNIPDIYAAGDVAQGPTAWDDPPKVHPLWTTAVEHGKIAGANMAGRDVSYQGSLGANVSEFFHMTVASIGKLQESSDVASKKYFDSQRKFYTKLFIKGNIPVGGIMLGSPEDVASFGILRTYILKKKAIPDLETMMKQAFQPLWPSPPQHFSIFTLKRDV